MIFLTMRDPIANPVLLYFNQYDNPAAAVGILVNFSWLGRIRCLRPAAIREQVRAYCGEIQYCEGCYESP